MSELRRCTAHRQQDERPTTSLSGRSISLRGAVMAQPFVDPCARGVINAEPCPRELGRELPSRQRRIILRAHP